MTKAELLVDLAARNHIKELIGVPEDVTPESETTGIKWYVQNVFEVINNAAVKRSIHFYVVDEGEEGEWAAYKDQEPEENVKPNQFKNWLNTVLYADADSVAWKVISENELNWQALVAILEENESNTLDFKGYLCTKDEEGDLVKQALNLTVDQMLEVIAKKI